MSLDKTIPIDMVVTEAPLCSGCGLPVENNRTYDVWVFLTLYDPETNESDKTGESLPDEAGMEGEDYVCYGECCLPKLRAKWRRFLWDMTQD